MANIALLLLTLSVAMSTEIILSPPSGSTGKPVGILWVQGAGSQPSSYTKIATEFQNQVSTLGYKVWIAISDMDVKASDNETFGKFYSNSVIALANAGFSGGPIFAAAHSLGGVMLQDWAKGNSDKVKGLMLMGSVLTRDLRSINSSGTSHFSYPLPVLTVGGTRDGIMRISRIAESYWHGVKNIESDQLHNFPVVALEGVAHHSFMSSPYPSLISSDDLTSSVSEDDAHRQVGEAMAGFVNSILSGASPISTDASGEILKPLVTAMEQEGNNYLKPPCYCSHTICPPEPTCNNGSPWNSSNAQRIMAGDLNGVSVYSNDYFHRVYSVVPDSLPYYNNTCAYGQDGCVLYGVSVTQAYYESLNEQATGRQPVAAFELKTKMQSRQRSQIHAGFIDPDFKKTDYDDICAEINQASITWAIENAGATAKKNYFANGTKMVTGPDLGPYNGGPGWMWTYMKYTMSDDKMTMTVQSPESREPDDFIIGIAAGFHFCKILSPYKVMEWIYVDSQYAFNTFNATTVEAA